MIISKQVKECSYPLVKSRSIENGHDCWGNLDWIEKKYVTINGIDEQTFDSWFIIYNDETNEIFYNTLEDFANDKIKQAKADLENRKQFKLF